MGGGIQSTGALSPYGYSAQPAQQSWWTGGAPLQNGGGSYPLGAPDVSGPASPNGQMDMNDFFQRYLNNQSNNIFSYGGGGGTSLGGKKMK